MSTGELFIDSSTHVAPDENGYGVADGESFEIVAVFGPYTLRSARFYGGAYEQQRAMKTVAEALQNAEVRFEK